MPAGPETAHPQAATRTELFVGVRLPTQKSPTGNPRRVTLPWDTTDGATGLPISHQRVSDPVPRGSTVETLTSRVTANFGVNF